MIRLYVRKIRISVCGHGITRSGCSKADIPVKTNTVPKKRLYTVNITAVAFKPFDVLDNILLAEFKLKYYARASTIKKKYFFIVEG